LQPPVEVPELPLAQRLVRPREQAAEALQP
jgi:hypothetical protein